MPAWLSESIGFAGFKHAVQEVDRASDSSLKTIDTIFHIAKVHRPIRRVARIQVAIELL